MRERRKKLTVVVTAGPTQEMIDPIRFISNRSTGVMGYQIAAVARARGHNVVLISGPTRHAPPAGVRFIPIVTVAELKKAVLSSVTHADCLFMVAAVSDWYLPRAPKHKIKRARRTLTLSLKSTPDILKAAGIRKSRCILVGFSLETTNPLAAAKKKLHDKHIDMIVANTLHGTKIPFGNTPLQSCIIDTSGRVEHLPLLSKRELAGVLVARVEKLYSS